MSINYPGLVQVLDENFAQKVIYVASWLGLLWRKNEEEEEDERKYKLLAGNMVDSRSLSHISGRTEIGNRTSHISLTHLEIF